MASSAENHASARPMPTFRRGLKMAKFSGILRPARLFGLAVIICVAGPAQADPGFKNVTFSAVKDGPTESVFRPDADKIFMRAEMADVPPDAKMTCAWIATQAVGAPQNF